jgi:uncharacterized membrane protein
VKIVTKVAPKSHGSDTFSTNFLNLFFGLYLVLAIGLMAYTPPFQSADSFAHFDRAVGISEGQLVANTIKGTSGTYLPSGMVNLEDVFSTIPFNPVARTSKIQFQYGWHQQWDSAKIFVPYSTGGNIPFLYLPQVFGIWLGRVSSGHVLVSYYLAELFNLVAFVALARWALSKFPKRLALPLGLFVLFPTVLSVVTSVTPDSLLLALSMVFAASCYTSYSQHVRGESAWDPSRDETSFIPQPLVRADTMYWIGFASLFFMTLEKPPLIVLGLFLPIADLYQDLRRYIRRALVFGVSAAACSELWSVFGAQGAGGPIKQSSFSPGRQMRLMLTSPLKDVDVVFHTLQSWWWLLTTQFFAGIGWLDSTFPRWFYLSLLILFIAALVNTEQRSRGDLTRFTWCLFVIIAALVLNCFALYVFYNSYDAAKIYGLQGRYFLPMIPPLVVILGMGRERTTKLRFGSGIISENASLALVCVEFLIVAEYLVTLRSRYWVK